MYHIIFVIVLCFSVCTFCSNHSPVVTPGGTVMVHVFLDEVLPVPLQTVHSSFARSLKEAEVWQDGHGVVIDPPAMLAHSSPLPPQSLQFCKLERGELRVDPLPSQFAHTRVRPNSIVFVHPKSPS